MKRTVLIFSILAFLVVGWSAAWFFIEGKVLEATEQVKERLASRGQEFECGDQTTGGFPFRITFNCSELVYANEGNGLKLETGPLRSVSQAYQPGQVLIELDAPAKIETLGSGAFDIGWSSLRASFKLGLSGRERTSVVGKDIDLEPLNDPSRVTISNLEYHDRLVGENDLDIALAILDLKELSPATLELIDFDMRSEVTFQNVHGEYARGQNLMNIIRRQGIEGNLSRFQVAAANGAEVKLSGPFNADRNGLLNATMKVEVKNLDALLRLLVFLNPTQAQAITQGGEAIKLLAPENAEGFRSVTLTIDKNVLKLGLIPIGRLPFWL